MKKFSKKTALLLAIVMTVGLVGATYATVFTAESSPVAGESLSIGITPFTTPPAIVTPPSIFIPAPNQPSGRAGRTVGATRRTGAIVRNRATITGSTRTINVWISGNRANLNLTGIALTQIIEEVQGGVIAIDLTQATQITVVHMPRGGLRRIAESGLTLELRFASNTVSLDSNTLNALVGEGGNWIRVPANP